MEDKVWGDEDEVQILKNHETETSPLFQRLTAKICAVCGDHSFGYHYGVLVCKGCRGFFRRSATTGRQKYLCVNLDWKCLITLETRNVCKACRLRKCWRKGMRFEGQDTGIAHWNSQVVSCLDPEKIITKAIDDSVVLRSTQTLSIDNLLENFSASLIFADTAIHIPEVNGDTFIRDLVTWVRGYHNAMQAQILLMVEWAKRIPGFRDLNLDDQVALLRPAVRKSMAFHAGIETSRSPEVYKNDDIIFHKKFRVPVKYEVLDDFAKQANLPEYGYVYSRTFQNIVKPLTEFVITDGEYMCFLALILLDPTVKGLVDKEKVRNLRRQVQTIILQEKAVNQNLPRRVMDLHLLLPQADSLSYQEMVILRDSNYFEPLGRHAKLFDDLYF